MTEQQLVDHYRARLDHLMNGGEEPVWKMQEAQACMVAITQAAGSPDCLYALYVQFQAIAEVNADLRRVMYSHPIGEYQRRQPPPRRPSARERTITPQEGTDSWVPPPRFRPFRRA